MDKYIMYKCTKSSNIACNVHRIISPLSGRVETMKRHNATMKNRDETTKLNTLSMNKKSAKRFSVG